MGSAYHCLPISPTVALNPNKPASAPEKGWRSLKYISRIWLGVEGLPEQRNLATDYSELSSREPNTPKLRNRPDILGALLLL